MKRAILVCLVILASCAPATTPTNNGTNTGAKALGTATVSITLNKIESLNSHYGAYLWVETSGGAFVKTLSWYDDWGYASGGVASGANGAGGGTKAFFVGSTSTSTTIDDHLKQSAAWRTAASITDYSGTFDAMTAATLKVPSATAVTFVFGGASATATTVPSQVTGDEYYHHTSLPSATLQGWDGKDASGTPVAAGTYKVRLALSRKNNGNATIAAPAYTEYVATLTVGSTSSTASFQPVTLGTTTVNAAAETTSPAAVLSASTITYTPTP